MKNESDRLKGRTAIITGSTSGIGLAIARALAEAGSNIVLNGLGDKETIEHLRGDFEKTHDIKALYSSADMSHSSEIKKMIDDTICICGSIDILVNNAGIQYVAPVHEYPEEKWDAILAINLSAAFKTTKAVLPYMIEKNWGRIINVASAHGLVASPFKSAYVAAKHGLLGLTKTVALETAETPLTCNAICPGYVRTPLVDKQIADQAKAHHLSEEQVVKEVMLKAQPNRRFIDAEDVAAFVLFLCSKFGSGMTGEILSMDGGWTAH